MATILQQLKKLKQQIKIPYRIVYVEREIMPDEFVEKVIYVHIWIQEQKMSWLSKGLKKIEGAIADVIPHTSAAERRARADAVSSYYQQKQSAIEEQNRIGAEKQMEQQRIQEKTIRSMRRKYRSGGFLQPMADSGYQQTLG